MKPVIRVLCLLAASALLMGAAGPVTCSQYATQDWAQAKAVIAKIKAGAAVASADIAAAVATVCANQGALNSAAQTAAQLIAAQGSGPKTTANLNNMNRGLATLNGACNGGGSTGAPLAQQAVAAYNAFTGVQGQLAAAQAAATKGQ